MSRILLKQGNIINENQSFIGDILIENERITKISTSISVVNAQEINCEGKIIMPGIIDDQVHFREPGLTHKACIQTEAIAAVAGGTTSFMEMPNTIPPATNIELLEQKFNIAKNTSIANYSFFLGVGNDTSDDALQINKHKKNICGLKIFMGSSTGNMLVDNFVTLNKVFRESEVLIATHCEKEGIVNINKAKTIAEFGENLDAKFHPIIRNEEACFESSFEAVQLAHKHNTRLHILHISTAKEIQLFSNFLPLKEKRITSEVCVHHLHFTADDYAKLGNLIKCNPAIKAPENKEALWQALLNDTLDIIATDHAPHTWEEKQQPYMQAPAGLPLVQHSLQMMLQYYHSGKISLEKIVEKMCHAPAICFEIKDRGYLREGYFADIVIVDINKTYTVSKENILYKCNWSPLENTNFNSSIETTIVNGKIVFNNGKIVSEETGKRLEFER